MGDEDDGLPEPLELVDLVEAFGNEGGVAHREDLVDQEDVRVDVDGDGEAEAHKHPGGVGLHGLIDEVFQLREADDLVETRGDLLLGQTQDDPVDVDVLPSGDLRVKPGP